MTITSEIIDPFSVKIEHLNGESGTGFIFSHGKSANHIYILSAKHCIYGKDFELKEKEGFLKIWFYNGKKYDSYTYNTRQSRIISTNNNEEDCGIIIVPSAIIKSAITETPTPFLAFSELDLEVGTNCYFSGFPRATNNPSQESKSTDRKTLEPKLITSKFNQTSLINRAHFHVAVRNYDNLNATAPDLLQGYSGSAVYTAVDGKIGIVGIIQTYQPNIPRFSGYGISRFNQLLLKDGLQTIPCFDSSGKYLNLSDVVKIFNSYRIDPSDCDLAAATLQEILDNYTPNENQSYLRSTSILHEIKQQIKEIEAFRHICLENSEHKRNKQAQIHKSLMLITSKH